MGFQNEKGWNLTLLKWGGVRLEKGGIRLAEHCSPSESARRLSIGGRLIKSGIQLGEGYKKSWNRLTKTKIEFIWEFGCGVQPGKTVFRLAGRLQAKYRSHTVSVSLHETQKSSLKRIPPHETQKGSLKRRPPRETQKGSLKRRPPSHRATPSGGHESTYTRVLKRNCTDT